MSLLGALGDLVLALSADTAKFESDLGKAQRMADKFGREVGKVMGNIAGAIGLVFTGNTVKEWIGGQIEAADAAGKLSQKVGLSVEKLSEYQVAARLADVSTEQLQAGLTKLAKNQADFVAGTGDAGAAFEALGISQKDVQAMGGDTAKLFELVVDKLSVFRDDANKTALEMKIFGKSGAELAPLINSFREAQNEAKELNAIIDKPTQQSAERFNDNLTRVKIATEAMGMQIARVLLPTLESLSARAVETAKDVGGMDKAARIADTGLKILVSGGTIITTVFKAVGEYIGGVAAALVQIGQGEFSQAWTTIKNISTDQAANVRNAVTSILETWDSTAATVAAKSDKTGKDLAAPGLKARQNIEADLAAAKKAMDEYIRQMEVRQKAQEELDSGVTISAQREDELKKARYASSEAIRDQLDPMREINREIERINELAVKGPAAGGLSAEEALAAYDKLIEKYKLWGERAQDVGRIVEDNSNIARELGMTFTSAFEDAIIGGKKFSDVLKGIEQDIARVILRKSVTEPLANAASGFLNNAFGNFFGGGKAAGGSVSMGTPYLVGEQGPELFVPGASGAIVPNGQLGGGAPNVYIDARGADNAGLARVENILMKMNASIERRAVSAVRDARTRGGL